MPNVVKPRLSSVAKRVALALANTCRPHAVSVLRAARPNPSVEARPNGKPARPAPGCAYHPSAGLAASPSAPPHLER